MPTSVKKTQGKSFKTAEINRMLALVEARLPFGAEQWQIVASLYNSQLPAGWAQRDGESLKRKFLGLKNKRKPTGDLDCPEEVRKAKRVFRLIEARCGVADLNDDDSESEDRVGVLSVTAHAANDGLDVREELPFLENSVDTVDNYDRIDMSVDSEPTLDVDGRSPRSDTASLLNASSPPAQTPPPRQSRPQGQRPLMATARTGLSSSELANLSSSIVAPRPSAPAPPPPVFLSQTAQRRIRLDEVLDSLANEQQAVTSDQSIVGVMIIMDQRQAAREAELRREREEREAIREERERQLRLQLAEQQSARDTQNQQLMMMFMAKIFGGSAQTPQHSDEGA